MLEIEAGLSNIVGDTNSLAGAMNDLPNLFDQTDFLKDISWVNAIGGPFYCSCGQIHDRVPKNNTNEKILGFYRDTGPVPWLHKVFTYWLLLICENNIVSALKFSPKDQGRIINSEWHTNRDTFKQFITDFGFAGSIWEYPIIYNDHHWWVLKKSKTKLLD